MYPRCRPKNVLFAKFAITAITFWHYRKDISVIHRYLNNTIKCDR